ncbi:MAG: tetratricopeptide repeat protein, partial [Candidatus Tectomicrobia bacterium]|nr:tetratricopeptide repeat protein [Candidatus Tectomicrobia bacterium]
MLQCARTVLWVYASLLSLLLSHPMTVMSGPAGTFVPAASLGEQALARGAFAEAIAHWREAVRVAAHQQQPVAQMTMLVQLAQAHQGLGQYQQALQHLRTALILAERLGASGYRATVRGALGQVHLLLGQVHDAAPHFHEAVQLARQAADAALTATILNNVGNLRLAQGQPTEALEAYRDSAQLARQAGTPLVLAQALTNGARVALQHDQGQEASSALDEAWRIMQALDASHDHAYGLISLGLAYNEGRLQATAPEAQARWLLQAAAALQAAVQSAQARGDVRALAYAWGYLGMLYEAEQRYQEALQLTRQAVLMAQRLQAPESLYRWQWQTGRLRKALGDNDGAIAAYRRAVETLQSFRSEIAQGRGSFREVVGPVYFGLVDLLLQRADTLGEGAQPYLREARDAVELLKAAELQDYFQDECVDAARARSTTLDAVSQTAVIVYPILLPDRLELLLGLPTGLERVAVPVSAAQVTQTVRELRYLLEKRTTHEYLPHAQQLYTWLIRPWAARLRTASIDTLVFVPDGPLRTIPL